MDNMRILIISPQIYPCIIGGVEVFNYYLINELAKRGHQVWVFTTCKHEWNHQNIITTKLNKFFLLHPTLSVNIHILFKLRDLRKCIDIIHVPYTSNSHLAYPVLLAKKIFDIPYIITIHGGGMHPWKPKVPHKLFFKYADAIVAVSEIIKKEYGERSGREIEVIPPLIPFKESKNLKYELRAKYGFSDNDLIILSLGSIKTIKGSDILLNSFLRLGQEYIRTNNLKLLYVGDGPMKSDLESKVNEMGYDTIIKFFGKIPHEKVPQMYKLADIYTISSFFEGTPISLLEAMFNGLPIIGTNAVGINNIISHGKNGLLFKNGDADDLKDKIKELIDNNNNNNNMFNVLGSSAKDDYFRNYVFEDVVTKHIKLCENDEEKS